jgi:DNA polymerase
MPARTRTPADRPEPWGAEHYIPEGSKVSLPQLRAASQTCHGCDLYKNATQAVFGEVAHDSTAAADKKAAHQGVLIMLIGEQPGDQEDLAGHPFVGPAGKLLDAALEDAGIDRKRAFVTNAVKHFKWEAAPRGKRRIHRSPSVVEVSACRPWLQREIALVKPKVIVCLGATAAKSLFGPKFRVTVSRGQATPVSPDLAEAVGEAKCLATIHPSAVLRMPDAETRESEFKALVKDLKAAHRLAH